MYKLKNFIFVQCFSFCLICRSVKHPLVDACEKALLSRLVALFRAQVEIIYGTVVACRSSFKEYLHTTSRTYNVIFLI